MPDTPPQSETKSSKKDDPNLGPDLEMFSLMLGQTAPPSENKSSSGVPLDMMMAMMNLAGAFSKLDVPKTSDVKAPETQTQAPETQTQNPETKAPVTQTQAPEPELQTSDDEVVVADDLAEVN